MTAEQLGMCEPPTRQEADAEAALDRIPRDTGARRTPAPVVTDHVPNLLADLEALVAATLKRARA
jgi:hypothetical protein